MRLDTGRGFVMVRPCADCLHTRCGKECHCASCKNAPAICPICNQRATHATIARDSRGRPIWSWNCPGGCNP